MAVMTSVIMIEFTDYCYVKTNNLHISASNIGMVRRNHWLFAGVTVDIEAGDLIHLIGPNGAGKSTFIRVLLGLLQPDEGQISWASGFAHGLIHVGHKLGLNPALTVGDNLKCFAQLRGGEATEQAVDDALEAVGLYGFDSEYLSRLSAGQQRKAALAKLYLPCHSSFWVLDEPFTALDVGSVAQLCQRIEDFISDGGAVLFTSHQTAAFSHHRRLRTLDLADYHPTFANHQPEESADV